MLASSLFLVVQGQMAPLFLTYIWSRENMPLLSQQWRHEAACFVLLQADNTSHTLSAFHFLQCRLKTVPLLHLTPRAKGEGEDLKFYKRTSSSPSNLSRGQKGHPPITHSLHTWSMQGKCGWKVPPGDKTSLVYLLFSGSPTSIFVSPQVGCRAKGHKIAS